MQNVLDFSQLVLPGARAHANRASNLARGSSHNGNKKQERPTQVSAQANDKGQADNEGKELL